MGKQKTEYRIDGYKQQARFFSIVFSGEHELRAKHVSLYLFLLNQNNRNLWAEWFKCPFDTGMIGAGIRSKRAYYDALNFLQECGLIKYIKGVNEWKAPKISIIILREEKTPQLVPQCEPVTYPLFDPPFDPQNGPHPEPQYMQLVLPLPEPLDAPRYKQITNNLNNYITSNWQTLKTLSIEPYFFIKKEKITDLKNYYEKKFPAQTGQLIKKYGEKFYEEMFREFSEGNIEKKWKNDEDLKKHFASYIRLKKQNTNKTKIANTENNELDIEQLKNKFQV